MKKILLPVIFLILASLACSWGGPSRAAKPRTPAAPHSSEPAPSSEEGGGQETGGQETESVMIPSLSVGAATIEAPTRITPAAAPDPYVALVASSLTLRVGETITITGTPMDLGLPIYYLVVRDDGVQDAAPMARASYDGVVEALPATSKVLAFISGAGSMESGIFVLRATSAGLTTITISATGEIHRADGAVWSGAGSGDILITVSP